MKNIKISKKLLSVLTAGMILVSPLTSHANSNNKNDSNNSNEFKLVQQTKMESPMTMVEYTLGIQNAYAYLSNYINYKNLQADLQCLYYLVNREYLSDEDEEELISSGAVFETNFDEGKFENFEHAYSLINVILDYNQSMVRKVNDANMLIDPSELCYDENDAALLHDMQMNYFNAYKNGRFYTNNFNDNPSYEKVFKQLTTLNAEEKAGNNFELGVGAEFLGLNIVGGDVMQALRDDMALKYSRKELERFFDRKELNNKQWILREDISLDLNRCAEVPDLESEVSDFAQLWVFVYDNVNNNIMKTFQVNCGKSK